MTTLIIGLFIVAALLSIPIAHALVLASVGGLLIIDKVPVHLAIEQMLAHWHVMVAAAVAVSLTLPVWHSDRAFSLASLSRRRLNWSRRARAKQFPTYS